MKKKDTLTLQKRLERLGTENHSLRQRLSILQKENRLLRKSLNKKDGLFHSMPGGLAVISQGKIREVNRKALEVLGYTAEEVLGRDFADFLQPESRQQVRDFHQRRLEGKPVPNPYTAVLTTKAGKGIPCDVSVEKIIWEGRMAFLATLTGLEKRKRRERDMIRKGKQELVLTLASGILKGIEGSVRGVLAPLRKAHSLKGPEVVIPRKDLLQMSEAAESLASLTRALESLSRERHETGREILFDLKGVVQEMVARVEAGLKEKASGDGAAIRFKTYLRPVSPVKGNPEELREVVAGLIDNAVAAMPAGGDLYLSVEESAGNAYVYVQDSGTGIPEEIMGRVMDPFFTTRGAGARGLGLSLAWAVLKRHQGDLEVESRKEQGTTVTLRIPLAKQDAREGGRPIRRRRKNLRILVLEEDHLVRELLFQVLCSKGYRVMTAEDVPKGVEQIKGGAFDLAILGGASGDLRGLKLVRRMRRIAPATRLALIAEQAEKDSSSLPAKERGDLLIPKPIDMTWLVDRIAEVLNPGTPK